MESLPVVLYVEDEPLIAMNISDVLEESGYQVEHVADGIAAMEKLDAGPTKYVALISDVRLPRGIDGWAIARHARELNPSIPVVYVSGDSVGDWAAQGVPKSLMLQKPYANAQLVAAVSTLINESVVAPAPES